MRRSISLNQVDDVKNETYKINKILSQGQDDSKAIQIVDSCQEYLIDNKEKQQSVPTIGLIEDVEPIEDDPTTETLTDKSCNNSPYGTLPKPMRKNISRSLVPKMRRMFEKARSCEPADSSFMPSTSRLSLRSLSPKPSSTMTIETEDQKSDGTESASSFEVVSNVPPPTPTQATIEPNSQSTCAESKSKGPNVNPRVRKRKGFVNKCVTRLQNMINSREALDKLN